MRTPHYIISGLIIISLSAGLFAFYTHQKNAMQKVKLSLLSNENAQLNQALKGLQAELKSFKDKSQDQESVILSLNKTLSELKRTQVATSIFSLATTNLEKEEETPKTPDNTMPSSTEALLAFAKKIQQGQNLEDIQSRFKQKFSEEPVDEYWAYDYESNIRDMVAADETNQFKIQELKCKSSACEIKITATKDNATHLGTLFSKTIGEMAWRDKGATVMFNSKVESGVMRIFIGRNANSFN